VIRKLIALIALVSLTGCVASLETKRSVRHPIPTAALDATRPESECKTLDDIHVYTGYGADVALSVGTGAGVLATATTGQMRTVGIDVGIGAAVAAATLVSLSQKYAGDWTEQCSQ
jgi:hypothetical protein